MAHKYIYKINEKKMLNFSQDIQIKKYLHIWKIPKYPFYISKKQCPSTKSVEFLIYKTMKQDNV